MALNAVCVVCTVPGTYTLQHIHNFIQHTGNLPYLSYEVALRGHVRTIVNHQTTNTHTHRPIHCASNPFQILRERNG